MNRLKRIERMNDLIVAAPETYSIDQGDDLPFPGSKGLTINDGIAVDARLVKSASHPRSKEQLKEEKKISQTPEGKLDSSGNPLKFCRDLESDWTVKK
jgi:hypothetical protein